MPEPAAAAAAPAGVSARRGLQHTVSLDHYLQVGLPAQASTNFASLKNRPTHGNVYVQRCKIHHAEAPAVPFSCLLTSSLPAHAVQALYIVHTAWQLQNGACAAAQPACCQPISSCVKALADHACRRQAGPIAATNSLLATDCC